MLDPIPSLPPSSFGTAGSHRSRSTFPSTALPANCFYLPDGLWGAQRLSPTFPWGTSAWWRPLFHRIPSPHPTSLCFNKSIPTEQFIRSVNEVQTEQIYSVASVGKMICDQRQLSGEPKVCRSYPIIPLSLIAFPFQISSQPSGHTRCLPRPPGNKSSAFIYHHPSVGCIFHPVPVFVINGGCWGEAWCFTFSPMSSSSSSPSGVLWGDVQIRSQLIEVIIYPFYPFFLCTQLKGFPVGL